MTCAACGFDNPASHRFCGNCGGRLPRIGDEVAAERRLVTVLFVDLVGFTPFSERHDAEDVRAMLARYFDLSRAAIARHRGVVDKLMGDGVMAVWGAQTVREDDAEQAILAALEIVRGVEALGEGMGARAGVNTGEAAVDMAGQDTGMVIGDLVNTAARLESAAAPGTVLVGAGTFRAAASKIEFVDGGDRQLKGKGTPVPTWIAVRSVRAPSDDSSPPMVGRQTELESLDSLVRPNRGDHRLVRVVGDAGVGKTRLVAEITRPDIGRSALVAACTSSEPMAPVADMIRSISGTADDASSEAATSAIDRFLLDTVPDAAERAWIRPAVLRLLAVDSAEVVPGALFARLRLLVERLADRHPLLILLDDAHHADATTLDFLEHLMGNVRGRSLAVVLVGRPEPAHWLSDGAHGRRSSRLDIGPMAADEIRTIVQQLVTGLPDAIAELIVQRSDGIPLYAVELVRMLEMEGLVREDASVLTVVGSVADLQIPESLTALASARLDALPARARRVVLDASVLGDRFDVTALTAVSMSDRHSLDASLAVLLAGGILALDDDPLAGQRFRFAQALVRETAYNTLSRADRRARHSAAARHFEARDAVGFARTIASHDLAAHSCALAADDLPGLAARAVASVTAAIEPAWALGGFSEVVSLCRTARPLVDSEVVLAGIDERAGEALIELGEYTEALELLERSLQVHEQAGDIRSLARVARPAGETMIRLGRPSAARSMLAATIDRCAGLADAPSVGALEVLLARALDFGGDSVEGFEIAMRVADAAARSGAAVLHADALVAAGTCCGRLALLDTGEDALRSGISLAERSGAHSVRLRGMTNLAWLLWDHRPVDAHRLTIEGAEFARRLGAASMERFMSSFRVALAQELGAWSDVDAAVEHLDIDATEGVDAGELLRSLIAVAAARGDDSSPLMARLVANHGVEPELHNTWLCSAVAMIATASGDHAGAEEAAWAAAPTGEPLSPEFWIQAARASLWAGAPERSLDALARIDSPQLSAPRNAPTFQVLQMAAMVAAGHGSHPPSAAAAARERLLALGLRWPAALAAVDAAMAWGPRDPVIAADLADARRFLESVNSGPYLRILDAVAAGSLPN